MSACPIVVRAGFADKETLTSASAGATLENGTVYTIAEDTVITADPTTNALKVAPGATAVIYLPSAMTLTVYGGKASGATGAGAGICVPMDSTLIVTGGGTLVARGGDAAKGSDGGNADDADQDRTNHLIWGGWGGAGGDGGAGAAAGIGGGGGAGGSGGARPDEPPRREMNASAAMSGSNGNAGGNGAAGGSSGDVYLLGGINCNFDIGMRDSGASEGAEGNKVKTAFYLACFFCAGSGGGGGGGAGGSSAPAGIGGGGGGGGGGGSGGNGGVYGDTANPTPDGGGGGGGFGAEDNNGRNGQSFSGSVSDVHGGEGGKGGAPGSSGKAGNIYSDVGAAVWAYGSTSLLSTNTHPAIEYNMTLFDDPKTSSNVVVRLGYPIPSPVHVPSRTNFVFKGWMDQNYIHYYDENGEALIHEFTNVCDLVLVPKWEASPDLPETIWVNGEGFKAGLGRSIAGCQYDGDSGMLLLTNDDFAYDIHGEDIYCEFRISVGGSRQDISFSGLSLAMDIIGGRPAMALGDSTSATLTTTAESSLVSGRDTPAIEMGEGSSITLAGAGPLKLTGGNGANDIDIAKGVTSVTVRIDIVDANIHLGTGRLPNSDSIPFTSSATGARVWAVAISNFAANASVSWSGLDADYTPLHTSADENGTAWLWLPEGAHTFSSIVDGATNVWAVRVDRCHSVALPFVPVGLTVNGSDAGNLGGAGWHYDRGRTVFLDGAGPFTVAGSTTNVGVLATTNMSVTLADASIDLSGVNDVSPFALVRGASVTMALSGTNVLAGGSGRAGLEVPSGTVLSVSGSGVLKAKGGAFAAGIGAGYGSSTAGAAAGSISISGGCIYATGTGGGAGIGGSREGNGGNITISGGVVMATGKPGGGADIGGGYGSTATSILVSGGTIYSDGQYCLGRGLDGPSSGNVTFAGGAIHVSTNAIAPYPRSMANDKVFPLDLDMGVATNKVASFTLGETFKNYNYGSADMYTDQRGNLRIWLPSTSGEAATLVIQMSDGSWHRYCLLIGENGELWTPNHVMVNGDFVFPGRDCSGTGWNAASDGTIFLNASPLEVQGLSTGGTQRIVVSRNAANAVTLNNLTLIAGAKKYGSAFTVSNAACTVTLQGTNMFTATGQYAAGLAVMSNSVLTIRAAVSESSSHQSTGLPALIANGGRYGAGIGSIGSGFAKPGRIVIESGAITATGGERAAGIGGGQMNCLSENNIVISGGVVTAHGGSYAAGIGSGDMSSGSADKTLPARAVCIAGGTVLSTMGAYASYDLISSANTFPVMLESSPLVITGGSVHGMNLSVFPNPSDAVGTNLCYVLFTDLEPGHVPAFAEFDTKTSNPAASEIFGYGVSNVVADATGSICLWLPYTNGVRRIVLDGTYFTAGGTSNNVFAADSGLPLPKENNDRGTCLFIR